MQDERIEQRVRAAYRARACAAGVACGAQIFAVGTGLLLPLALNAAYWAAVPALLLGGVIGLAAPRRLSKAPGSAFCAVLALSLLVCGALLRDVAPLAGGLSWLTVFCFLLSAALLGWAFVWKEQKK